jgi:hypothetical protein
MIARIFADSERESFIKTAAACLLILIFAVYVPAQYKGAPVKKNRLIQAIRSRQLQTRDIVTIITTNGVDFRLTPEIRKSLVAAGARPEVIKAVSINSRFSPLNDGSVAKVRKSSSKTVVNRRSIKPFSDYDDLLEQAIDSYKDRGNAKSAVQFLETAAKVNPKNPAAYQMLGFVYLYGMNNFAQAEKFMKESVTNGGSAVFRVFHDDNGKFTGRCTGSLFISEDVMRFESDDNRHTFETSTANIDKIKLDTESTRVWKKHSVFKIFLKIGKDKAKFRFAPLTGEEQESEMVGRFINAANAGKNFSGLAVNSPSPVFNFFN